MKEERDTWRHCQVVPSAWLWMEMWLCLGPDLLPCSRCTHCSVRLGFFFFLVCILLLYFFLIYNIYIYLIGGWLLYSVFCCTTTPAWISRNYMHIPSLLSQCRPRDWTCGRSGGRREWEELRRQRWQCIHTTCVTQFWRTCGLSWICPWGPCGFWAQEPAEAPCGRFSLRTYGIWSWKSHFRTGACLGFWLPDGFWLGASIILSLCVSKCASFTSALGDLIYWRGSTCNPCLEKCLLNGKSPGCDPLNNKSSNGVRSHCSLVYV